MDERFMSSGIFQFLDEVNNRRGPLFDYGFMIGMDELSFDEDLMSDETELHNVLRKTGRKVGYVRNTSSTDW